MIEFDGIKNLRDKVTRLQGKRQQLQSFIHETRKNIRVLEVEDEHYQKAVEIVRIVGLETQKQLEFHIASVVTAALKAVFGNEAYEMKVEFVERRNTTECDLFFEKDGRRYKPMDASGGGAVDVAAFALRVAAWSMKKPKLRNTIILDEPLRFLSKDLQAKASRILKELSEQLGIQFIIVTHEEELTDAADKIFQVSKINNVSKVKCI